MDCLGCDKMFHRAKICDANKVTGPIYVFPDVNFQKNGYHDKEKHRNQHLDKDNGCNTNSKHLVMPNRNEWKHTGWMKKNYQ